MDDYEKPKPFPDDLFTKHNFFYQAYVLLATKNTGEPVKTNMVQYDWMVAFSRH